MKTETWETKDGHKVEVSIPDAPKQEPRKDNRVNYRRLTIPDCTGCKFVQAFWDKNYDWICTKNDYFSPVDRGCTCDLWETKLSVM